MSDPWGDLRLGQMFKIQDVARGCLYEGRVVRLEKQEGHNALVVIDTGLPGETRYIAANLLRAERGA